ncbi:hypothetical protein [Actinacidiphila sp. ITFR-21]|uniref:hypothetical protein n=1 Tax=Actinacidiphila sp. ITFR-21 TaxID=3075199 RepID=UPI0028890BE7|nr:hypothetical protein [Streptomyces sp. ITFR-21]WNI19482.1 hypothetical protein RLT57_30675 [Streptomyces sp. ITFR-21]
MADSGWETYSPENDPAVDRWQQESEKLANGEAAGADPEARPVGGAYQLEDARRRYLTTILDNALTAVSGREPANPDAEQLSLLDDFFTRAVVFPDPHGSGVHPRPHQALFGWTSEQPFIDHASDPGRALALFLLAYLDHHGTALTAAARVPRTPDTQAAAHALLLQADDQDPGVVSVLEALAGRAWDAYGIALRYTGAADQNDPEATMEAMRHAVQAVARGFAAATLARIADDPALDLTLDQCHYLDALAAEIDLDTIEALDGSADLPHERADAGRPVEDSTADVALAEGRRIAQRDTDEGDEGSEAPPELIEQVSAVCEQHFAAVTGTSSHPWEAESRELVGIALRTVRLADRDAYPQVLQEFLNANRARLERLWARYGPGGLFAEEGVLVVDMAACCVLCERIEAVPLWLEGVWAQEGQEANALERLHDAWLYNTSDKDGGR